MSPLLGEPVQDLRSILDIAAERYAARSIIVYSRGDSKIPQRLQYSELRTQALSNASLLRQNFRLRKGQLILLHFKNHLDNIVWLWSVLYAGCVPVMSTPFTENLEQREKHIQHLQILLQSPICITNTSSLGDFLGQDTLTPTAVENLVNTRNASDKLDQPVSRGVAGDPVSILMLTSGSSGKPKAVCLGHEQIFAAIKGKSLVVKLVAQSTFLNWIGLDHVAGLIEIHIQAMYQGMDQVHVHPTNVAAEPSLFLNLLGRHRVSRSFAPNFFLAQLRKSIETDDPNIDQNLDLSCLSILASGGESNPMETCTSVADLLHKRYGAPANVIVPGFGMTETCAGAIFNTDCPDYDIRNNHALASVGKCMPGIKMRLTLAGEVMNLASSDKPGDLEIKGPVLFKEYYNNAAATKEAFTADGWFKTGDQAIIDPAGYLSLIGRTKEVLNINGVKYSSSELQTTIDEGSVAGVTPSYTVCFSHRPAGSETEQICVFYLPTYLPEDSKARVDTLDSIVTLVMLQTMTRPTVLPLDRLVLQKTTLGKISQAKIRTAYERGDYAQYQELDDESIKLYNASRDPNAARPSTKMEILVLGEFCEIFNLRAEDMDIDRSIFGMGITSVDLIRLKRNIERQFSPNIDIPMVTLLTNPTIRALANSIERPLGSIEYSPVVKLQHEGFKTPLWLVHPGVGEVLVFLNLAKHLTDRPIYALRARGFNAGETYFGSIQEAVTTYHAAIKATQPTGPYAIAGYSYGTMLAFETVKVLERNGDEVRFLGSFNLPPHIRHRMSQLIWSECVLHLSYFLDLISEATAGELSAPLQSLSREEALAHIVEIANPARMTELALTSEALGNWANLAFALQGIAREYEPSGTAAAIDVFFATPLKAVAQSKREWVEGPLSKWRDFVRGQPRFHEVDGAHYTMIGPDHVKKFAMKLKIVLESRGV